MTVGAAKDGGYAYSAVSISRGFGNAQKSPRHKIRAVATRFVTALLVPAHGCSGWRVHVCGIYGDIRFFVSLLYANLQNWHQGGGV